jgi:hypothetical protein
MDTQNFEKLGAFYLGRVIDREKDKVSDDLLLYDSKDLTTHAVCVGMTGSGKTGLCISILEEAALDGIPALIIDPKGDLGNLMLTFPQLQPSDFRPWIDEDEAARKGFSPQEYAVRMSQTWKKGLADWGQDGQRIEKLRQSADISIYTPGSNTGLPLTVLRSFEAPPASLAEDSDALRDRIMAAVSGLLALLGRDTDPIQSRDHILLSNLFHGAWKEGRSLDIPSLIREVQSPPFQNVGVFDLESFYPSKERFSFAMVLNNLLASPGFASWMEGEPLDIGRLLYSKDGRPRLTILSIAHLSDQERMFFVTILLNEVIAWMRTQPGTSSLRALLYMDEIYGYFPPTSMPPSKTPMLTLLKQARAFGLGVVLSTQNPVDLDYKGLSNAGTWFIGRLQTERDKDRVLDGLEGASTTAGIQFDRNEINKTISGLKSRVFLMHNVHEDSPLIFNTRWALSFLRGPLTRTQIQTLMEERKKEVPAISEQPPSVPGKVELRKEKTISQKPVLPPEISQFFLSPKASIVSGENILYKPVLYASSKLHFINSSAGIDSWKQEALLVDIPQGGSPVLWDEAVFYGQDQQMALEKTGIEGAKYGPLPPASLRPSSYTAWNKNLVNFLYQNKSLQLWKSVALKEMSQIGEREGEFRANLVQKYHEQRDLKIEKLRKSYSPKLVSLQDQIRRAQYRLQKEQSQYGQQKAQTAISVGATVLGALLGRKIGSAGNIGRATTSMRGLGRATREKQDIALVQNEIKVLQERLMDMEVQFKADLANFQQDFRPEELDIQEIFIKPRKSDISISRIALVWTPWELDSMGLGEPAY